MDIVHSDLKPVHSINNFQRLPLMNSDFRPRLTDYGLITIISDPNTADPDTTTSPSVGTVRYMAPELLNPSGFGLKNSNPTKKSDIYAFGMVTYQVGNTVSFWHGNLSSHSGGHRTTTVPRS